MEPIISEPIEFTFVGVSKLDQSNIGMLWAMFEEKKDQIKFAEKDARNELHIFPEKTDKSQKIVVMVGFNVEKTEEIPLSMTIKKLTETNYAIFDYHLKNGEYSWISDQIDTWLKNSNYKMSPRYSIQRYDDFSFSEWNKESIIQFYIPLQPKN